jgi:thioredoxin-like negative regulator of GroEL
VNFDENPRLIERYAVQGLPTILVIKDGQPADRRVGLMGRRPCRTCCEGTFA